MTHYSWLNGRSRPSNHLFHLVKGPLARSLSLSVRRDPTWSGGEWNPIERNRLRVADITYCRTWEGFLTWRRSSTATRATSLAGRFAGVAELVTEAIEMAVARRGGPRSSLRPRIAIRLVGDGRAPARGGDRDLDGVEGIGARQRGDRVVLLDAQARARQPLLVADQARRQGRGLRVERSTTASASTRRSAATPQRSLRPSLLIRQRKRPESHAGNCAPKRWQGHRAAANDVRHAGAGGRRVDQRGLSIGSTPMLSGSRCGGLEKRKETSAAAGGAYRGSRGWTRRHHRP